jgi:hypothetical protein
MSYACLYSGTAVPRKPTIFSLERSGILVFFPSHDEIKVSIGASTIVNSVEKLDEHFLSSDWWESNIRR